MENKNIEMITDARIGIYTPKIVGYYIIGTWSIPFTKKPNWFHRFFCNIMLGFRWKDEN